VEAGEGELFIFFLYFFLQLFGIFCNFGIFCSKVSHFSSYFDVSFSGKKLLFIFFL